MTDDTIRKQDQPTVDPLDDLDHVRGPTAARLILEYGDYECPYSRQAFRAVQLLEQQANGGIRFAFRHFPLPEIHPHAFAAAAASEAAALVGRIRRDIESGLATGTVRGTPTLFIDGVVPLGSYDAPTLREALTA